MLEILSSLNRAMIAVGFRTRTPYEFLGSGSRFLGFAVTIQALGEVVVKVANPSSTAFGNDPPIPAFDLLNQEMVLSNWAQGLGIRSPRVFGVFSQGDIHFAILQRVHRHRPSSSEDAAEIAAVLHSVSPPIERTRLQLGLDFKSYITSTVARRARFIAAHFRLCCDAFLNALPSLTDVVWPPDVHRLLHMDLRDDNIFASNAGTFIIDWSASLVGNPALELVRLEEFGIRNRVFDAVYGRYQATQSVSSLFLNLYRLHTVCMLVIFFGFHQRSGAVQPLLEKMQTLQARIVKEL